MPEGGANLTSIREFKLWNRPFKPQEPTVDDERVKAPESTPSFRPEAGRRSTRSRTRSGEEATLAPRRARRSPNITPRREYEHEPTLETTVTVEDSNQVSQPPAFENHTPDISGDKLKRPQIKLDPFQESIYYSLIPIENFVETVTADPTSVSIFNPNGDTRVPITSSAVIGESGSGLTTLIAKKAYENYQDGRPTIVLTHREHLFGKMAQTIVDFAEESKRENLRDSIEMISGNADLSRIDPNKSIYILSADKLKNYLVENSSYKASKTTPSMLWIPPVHNRLSDILPLNNIREILVDEVNRYTGVANEGLTKVLTTLLYETGQDPERNPVHLFGTSSTPYVRGDESERLGRHLLLEFDHLFPRLATKNTPPAHELIEGIKHYKRPIVKQMTLEKEVAEAMLNRDAKQRLLDAEENSINDRVVNICQRDIESNPDKKIHIIANTREHADQLCALFNLRGVNAKVLTSRSKGYFEQVDIDDDQAIDRTRGILRLNDSQVAADKTVMRKVTETTQQVVDGYEGGDCSVIIDIDYHSCFHSTKTGKVIVLNLEETDSRLRHYLGEAVRDRAQTGNPSIEYLFLRPNIAQRFIDLISSGNSSLASVPKRQAETGIGGDVTPHIRTETELDVRKLASFDYHREWYSGGLSVIVRNKFQDNSLEAHIDEITQEFLDSLSIEKDFDHTKAVILGIERDPELFRAYLEFAAKDLNQDPSTVVNYVPELTGVPDQAAAFRVVSQTHEKLVLSDQLNNADEAWLVRLDAALGINEKESGNDRDARRNKFFAQLISQKFGLEFLENKHFLNHAIRVFMGAEIDFKLFGLLVNVLSSDAPKGTGEGGFSFEDIRSEFPDLIGAHRQVPFTYLQRKILAKYPDGPPMDQTLLRFFTEQLYDDFAIDFGTLVDSVTAHSRGTDQELINGSVQDEIYRFLESLYRDEADRSLPSSGELRPEDDQLREEIARKARRHLSPLTRQVLYNQLLGKIWGQDRLSRIDGDDFITRAQADTIVVENIDKSVFEDQIDLTKVDPNWVLRLDEKLRTTQEQDLAIDLKPRLASVIASFLAKNDDSFPLQRLDFVNNLVDHGDEYLTINSNFRSRHNITDASFISDRFSLTQGLSPEQQRRVDVLSASVDPENLTDADRNLLREFINFHKPRLKLDEFIPGFYDRLGVQTLHEARLVIDSIGESLANVNQDWIDVFGSADERNDQLVRFLMQDVKRDIFNRPEDLRRTLQVLAGDYSGLNSPDEIRRAQDLNREFIDFANQGRSGNNRLELHTLIPSHLEILGIQNRDELFAVMRDTRFVDFNAKGNDAEKNPTLYQYRSPGGVQSFVQGLAQRIGMQAAELYNLAGIRSPASFYSEPLVSLADYFKDKLEFTQETAQRLDDELRVVAHDNEEAIKARELLITAFPDDYSYGSLFELEGNDENHRVQVKFRADVVKCVEQYRQEIAGTGKSKRTKKELQWVDADYQEYTYENNCWGLRDEQFDPDLKFYSLGQALKLVFKAGKTRFDENWLRKLGLLDTSNNLIQSGERVNNFINLIAVFLQSHHTIRADIRSHKIDLQNFVTHLLGLKLNSESVTNPETLFAAHELLRSFIQFTNGQFINPSNQLSLTSDQVFGIDPIALEDVVKESPKLVGVRSLAELQSVVGHNFPVYQDLENAVMRFHNIDELPTINENQTYKQISEFLADFTSTDMSKILKFADISDIYKTYRRGIQHLQDVPNLTGIKSRMPLEEQFRQFILVNVLFPFSQGIFALTDNLDKEALYSGTMLANSKRSVLGFSVLNNRIDATSFVGSEDHGVPIIREHRTLELDESSDEWQETIATSNQRKTRMAFLYNREMSLVNTDLVMDYSLIRLFDHDQRGEYIQKLINLMTEFLYSQDPSLFRDGNESKLRSSCGVLCGQDTGQTRDRQLINDFVDFLAGKYPGKNFSGIKQDSRFADLFVDRQARFTQVAEYIKNSSNIEEIIDEQRTKTDQEVLEALLKRAQDDGQPPVSVREFTQYMIGETSFEDYLEDGFRLLADQTSQVFYNKDIEAINSKARSFVEGRFNKMTEEKLDCYKSSAVLRKLFPADNRITLSTAQHNYHQLIFADWKIKKDTIGLCLGFDGSNFVLIKKTDDKHGSLVRSARKDDSGEWSMKDS